MPETSGGTRPEQVSEQESRAVAEAARETEWRKPCFAKELFLGRFRLDLVHPHPQAEREDAARGEEFLDRLRALLRDRVRRPADRAGGPDPGRGRQGPGGARRVRHEDPAGVRRPRACPHVYYNRALDARRLVPPEPRRAAVARTSRSASPSRSSCSAPRSRSSAFLPRCAAGAISAFLLTEPDVGSDPARLGMTAIPTDGRLGVRPRRGQAVDHQRRGRRAARRDGPGARDAEGRRGGITAFVVEADSAGITVEHRNAFMGLRGHRERRHPLPPGAGAGRERRRPARAQGLKIALTTLNTGRLSLPGDVRRRRRSASLQDRPASGRRAGAVGAAGRRARGGRAARSPSSRRPTFAMEAVLDLSAQLADEDRNDIRIEAALAKLWSQRDGLAGRRRAGADPRRPRLRDRRRRWPPAASAAIPAEQMLRDLRINRIFEGSTEIMHLLIAREAVDAHLSVAGDIIDPKADLRRQGEGRGAGRAASTPAGCRSWSSARATSPTVLRRVRAAGQAPALRRAVARRKLARSTFYGMARWQGRLEHKQGFLGRVVDIGAELFAMSAAVRPRRDAAGRRRRARREAAASWPTCSASRPGCGSTRCSTGCGATPTTLDRRLASGCWTAATPGWRRASSTRRPRGPGSPTRRPARARGRTWPAGSCPAPGSEAGTGCRIGGLA